ncbi:hypothetical protein [Chelativorans sp. YIM 93263]|uniref:hypothetical protein n=1 Tax=Chelativorans sp. YIM 93263 TaxID=2906648 RepID=UPI0023794955|nr:hypothetical protein [Chelativorans sp. YIM 93263]
MSGTAKVETMTKGDFAELIGVSPGRVSQYIGEGKIYGEALVGNGRSAKIVPDVARAQLNKTLEPSQRLGANGAVLRSVKTRRESEALPLAPAAAEPVHDDLAAERLKQMRLKTAQAERAEALEAGRYMLAEDARREMGRAVGEAFKVMDQGLRDLANALAAEFGISERDAHQVLQKAFRDIRTKAAQSFRVQAEAVQPMVADDGGTEMRDAS